MKEILVESKDVKKDCQFLQTMKKFSSSQKMSETSVMSVSSNNEKNLPKSIFFFWYSKGWNRINPARTKTTGVSGSKEAYCCNSVLCVGCVSIRPSWPIVWSFYPCSLTASTAWLVRTPARLLIWTANIWMNCSAAGRIFARFLSIIQSVNQSASIQ